MNEQCSIFDAVAATLREMGIRLAPMWTALIKKGYLVCHKYRFDGGYAVWLMIQKNAIEIYDNDGKLLKTVTLEMNGEEKAA
jgi:hypothetical protein